MFTFTGLLRDVQSESVYQMKEVSKSNTQTPVKPSSQTEGVEAGDATGDQGIKVRLFDLLKGLETVPIVGLNYITEIQNKDNHGQPRYQCRLCDTTHSINFINAHLTSHDHRSKFLRNNYPLLYSRTAGTKELVLKYVKEIEERYGRESVWVKTLKATGPNGMAMYSEPVFVKGPWHKPTADKGKGTESIKQEAKPVPPSPIKDKGANPGTEFAKIIEGLDCTPLLGLQYITEVQHPFGTYSAKYECSLCHHIGNGTPLTAQNILNHVSARGHRLNFFREMHDHIYKEILSHKDRKDQNTTLTTHTKAIESTMGRGLISHIVSPDLSYWPEEEAGEDTGTSSAGLQPLPSNSAAGNQTSDQSGSQLNTSDPVPAPRTEPDGPPQPPALTESMPVLTINPKTSPIVQDILLKKDGAFSWKVEFDKMQTKMEEGRIIQTDRKSRFSKAYDDCPAPGIQWILEVQRPNIRTEPYYLCRLCEEKIIFNKIVSHIRGLRHKISYMGQCYAEMYQFITQKKFTNVASLRHKVNMFAEDIGKKEMANQGPVVLMELDIGQTAPQTSATQMQTGTHSSVETSHTGTPSKESWTVNETSQAVGAVSSQGSVLDGSALRMPHQQFPRQLGPPAVSAQLPQTSSSQPSISGGFSGTVYPYTPGIQEPSMLVTSQGQTSTQAYPGNRDNFTGTVYPSSPKPSHTATVCSPSAAKSRPSHSSSSNRADSTNKRNRFDKNKEKQIKQKQDINYILISDEEDFSNHESDMDLDSEQAESEYDKPLSELELKAVEDAYRQRLDEEDEDFLSEFYQEDNEEGVDPTTEREVEVSVSLDPTVFEVANNHKEQPRSSGDIPGLTLIPKNVTEEKKSSSKKHIKSPTGTKPESSPVKPVKDTSSSAGNKKKHSKVSTEVSDVQKELKAKSQKSSVTDKKDRSHTSDSLKGKSHTFDSLKGKSHPSDSMKGKSHASDSLKGKSHTSDSLKSKSQTSDSLKGKSHTSDSLKGKSHTSDSLKGKSHTSDSLKSKSHTSDSLKGKSHTSDSLKSKSHTSDSLKGKSHTSDSLKAKSHTSVSLKTEKPASSSPVTTISDKIKHQSKTEVTVSQKDDADRDGKKHTSKMSQEMKAPKPDKKKDVKLLTRPIVLLKRLSEQELRKAKGSRKVQEDKDKKHKQNIPKATSQQSTNEKQNLQSEKIVIEVEHEEMSNMEHEDFDLFMSNLGDDFVTVDEVDDDGEANNETKIVVTVGDTGDKESNKKKAFPKYDSHKTEISEDHKHSGKTVELKGASVKTDNKVQERKTPQDRKDKDTVVSTSVKTDKKAQERKTPQDSKEKDSVVSSTSVKTDKKAQERKTPQDSKEKDSVVSSTSVKTDKKAQERKTPQDSKEKDVAVTSEPKALTKSTKKGDPLNARDGPLEKMSSLHKPNLGKGAGVQKSQKEAGIQKSQKEAGLMKRQKETLHDKPTVEVSVDIVSHKHVSEKPVKKTLTGNSEKSQSQKTQSSSSEPKSVTATPKPRPSVKKSTQKSKTGASLEPEADKFKPTSPKAKVELDTHPKTDKHEQVSEKLKREKVPENKDKKGTEVPSEKSKPKTPTKDIEGKLKPKTPPSKAKQIKKQTSRKTGTDQSEEKQVTSVTVSGKQVDMTRETDQEKLLKDKQSPRAVPTAKASKQTSSQKSDFKSIQTVGKMVSIELEIPGTSKDRAEGVEKRSRRTKTGSQEGDMVDLSDFVCIDEIEDDAEGLATVDGELGDNELRIIEEILANDEDFKTLDEVTEDFSLVDEALDDNEEFPSVDDQNQEFSVIDETLEDENESTTTEIDDALKEEFTTIDEIQDTSGRKAEECGSKELSPSSSSLKNDGRGNTQTCPGTDVGRKPDQDSQPAGPETQKSGNQPRSSEGSGSSLTEAQTDPESQTGDKSQTEKSRVDTTSHSLSMTTSDQQVTTETTQGVPTGGSDQTAVRNIPGTYGEKESSPGQMEKSSSDNTSQKANPETTKAATAVNDNKSVVSNTRGKGRVVVSQKDEREMSEITVDIEFTEHHDNSKATNGKDASRQAYDVIVDASGKVEVEIEMSGTDDIVVAKTSDSVVAKTSDSVVAKTSTDDSKVAKTSTATDDSKIAKTSTATDDSKVAKTSTATDDSKIAKTIDSKVAKTSTDDSKIAKTSDSTVTNTSTATDDSKIAKTGDSKVATPSTKEKKASSGKRRIESSSKEGESSSHESIKKRKTESAESVTGHKDTRPDHKQDRSFGKSPTGQDHKTNVDRDTDFKHARYDRRTSGFSGEYRHGYASRFPRDFRRRGQYYTHSPSYQAGRGSRGYHRSSQSQPHNRSRSQDRECQVSVELS